MARRHVFRGAFAKYSLDPAHVSFAAVSRGVAPEENPGAGIEKIDVRNKNVGAPTEIRIAPQKIFAAPAKSDDAPAEKIA